MHTVIESPGYLRAAERAGISAEEMVAAVNLLALNPEEGVVIAGTKGFRKVRLAGRGFGKSGGYRLITFYAERGLPVVLVTMFSKGDRANLSKAERNALAAAEPALRRGLLTFAQEKVHAQRTKV